MKKIKQSLAEENIVTITETNRRMERRRERARDSGGGEMEEEEAEKEGKVEEGGRTVGEKQERERGRILSTWEWERG